MNSQAPEGQIGRHRGVQALDLQKRRQLDSYGPSFPSKILVRSLLGRLRWRHRIHSNVDVPKCGTCLYVI